MRNNVWYLRFSIEQGKNYIKGSTRGEMDVCIIWARMTYPSSTYIVHSCMRMSLWMSSPLGHSDHRYTPMILAKTKLFHVKSSGQKLPALALMLVRVNHSMLTVSSHQLIFLKVALNHWQRHAKSRHFFHQHNLRTHSP